jgi:Tfp pilus assembly protein PilW
VVELLIGAVLTAIVSFAAFRFYQAHHQFYLAQNDIADRQGNLRFAADVIGKSVRNAGYLVPGTQTLRVSAGYDTLVVYMGDSLGATIDTIRYYVNRSQTPPALVVKRNGGTASTLAMSIDTVRFVPVGGTPPRGMSVVLVASKQTQYAGSALETRRRLGETVNLRNG